MFLPTIAYEFQGFKVSGNVFRTLELKTTPTNLANQGTLSTNHTVSNHADLRERTKTVNCNSDSQCKIAGVCGSPESMHVSITNKEGNACSDQLITEERKHHVLLRVFLLLGYIEQRRTYSSITIVTSLINCSNLPCRQHCTHITKNTNNTLKTISNYFWLLSEEMTQDCLAGAKVHEGHNIDLLSILDLGQTLSHQWCTPTAGLGIIRRAIPGLVLINFPSSFIFVIFSWLQR